MTGDPNGLAARPPGPASGASQLRPLDQRFDSGSLYALRSAVAAHAAATGLGPQQVYDVTAAAHELASNAVRHGAGHGRLRLWVSAGSLYCQVRDGGPALASAAPASGQAQWPARHGHGLWIVRQVASQLGIQHGSGGTAVTARFAIATPSQPAHASLGPAALPPPAAADGSSAGPAAELAPLNILVREQGAWTTVRVEGELDYLSSVDMIMVLGGILSTGKRRIAVDLSNVTLCDSSGLRCVLRASSQVHERGGQLVIVHQGPLHGSPGLRELARMIPVLPDPPR